MSKLLKFTQIKAAGEQFNGNEFRIQSSNRRRALKLKEINLQMGTEAKTFRIEKKDAQGQVLALIQQSIDFQTGNPAPTTSESVVIVGAEFEVHLLPGEQIQVTTAGAIAAMSATIYLEETPFE